MAGVAVVSVPAAGAVAVAAASAAAGAAGVTGAGVVASDVVVAVAAFSSTFLPQPVRPSVKAVTAVARISVLKGTWFVMAGILWQSHFISGSYQCAGQAKHPLPRNCAILYPDFPFPQSIKCIIALKNLMNSYICLILNIKPLRFKKRPST
jgi:hypothetical protein